MGDYFVDSSALVKRYMPEHGTVWVRQLAAPQSGNHIFVAQITLVEAMSAIARKYHDGEISLALLQSYQRLITAHTHQQYHAVQLTDAIVNHAATLHHTHRLRAYDSVQLASALLLKQYAEQVGRTVDFIASDNRLLQAAQAEGLATDNPNHHP